MSSKDKQTEIYTVSRIYRDYLLMLIAPCAVAVWYYGKDAIYNLLVCSLTAFVCDLLGSIIVTRQFYVKDTSAICSGLMIALMLPASAPLYVGALASAFAVLVIKIPFGGGKNTPFVPAAAGFATAAVCFKDLVFNYTSGRGNMVARSLGSTLLSGGSLRLSLPTVIDILTGNIYGPMGTGCVLVFISALIYLGVRRKSALLSAAGFLISCTVISLIFPRTNGSIISSLVLELSSGSLLFACVFLMTDFPTQPKHSINKLLYGALTGIILMGMRHLGAYEEPVCFAVLLGNAFSSLTDVLAEKIQHLFSGKKADKEGQINET